MKKPLSLLALVAVLSVFQYCASSKAKKTAEPKTTFEAHVMPLIRTKCAPCHIAPEGKKKHFMTYDVVKADIDSMITRVKLMPGQKGFMPFKKTEQLPDSLIQVFVKWKADGFIER